MAHDKQTPTPDPKQEHKGPRPTTAPPQDDRNREREKAETREVAGLHKNTGQMNDKGAR